MSKPNSTYRRAADSTFNPERRADAVATAERVREEWRRSGVVDLPAALAESPCLLADRSVFFDLVQSEFHQRRAASLESSPTEYCLRFAGLDQGLLHSIHRLVQAERFLGDNPDLLHLLGGAPAWPAPGGLFEGFYLAEELGRGAVSRVYVARQAELGDRQVVLKVTHGPRGEALTLGKLRHPGVVPVYSTGEESVSGLGWICMPLLGRYTLADAVASAFAVGEPKAGSDLLGLVDGEGRLTGSALMSEAYEPCVVRIAAQLAEALEYVHSKGLLHGDLKPSNVLLTDEGTPMLIDFNLARDARAENSLLGGTLPYMPPEQLREIGVESGAAGVHGTTASEVFSFGVLLYQMLLGRLPFEADTEKQDVRQVASRLLEAQERNAPQLGDDLGSFDPRLSQLVEKCLELDPTDRFVSFKEVVRVLRGLQTRRAKWLRVARQRPRAVFGAMASVVLVASFVAAGASRLMQEQTLADAQRLVAEEDFDRAAETLKPYVADHPKNTDAHRLLAKCYLELGDYKTATIHYAAAWKNSDSPLDLAMLGYCSNLTGDHERAISAYRDAKRRDLLNAAVENNLAASLMMRLSQHYNPETSREIEAIFFVAYRLSPKNATIRFNMLHHYVVAVEGAYSDCPSYPVAIAENQNNAIASQRAVEFLVTRQSSPEELLRHGLPNLRTIVATKGIDMLEERLTGEALAACKRIPGFAELRSVPQAEDPPAPPVFLSPATELP